MSPSFSLRKTLALFLCAAVAFAGIQAGCGDSGDSSSFPGSSGDQSSGASGNLPGFNPGDGDGSSGASSGNLDATGILDVTPPTATITVTIADGVVTAPPQAFVASYNGQAVNATWLLDRGELGDIAASGVFTANGKNVGDGIITARYGAREGTAKIKVIVNATQNGVPVGTDAGGGGFGGLGGVGGEPLGPAVAADIVTKLKTQTNAPATPAELGFLYPYDLTVWPRGLLPPLLMWQTTHEGATAVYVKLSQSNYAYEGTFSLAQLAAGDPRKRVRLDEIPWKTATQGNDGSEDLKLEVKIYTPSDDKVWGPITRTWKVAPGVLKGTVYYNSYDSVLTTGGGAETGGVIAIQPRSPNPVLALPAEAGKCHVCHEVSADGSTIWVQDDSYANGFSYDLTKNPIVKTPYLTSTKAENNRKFVWSAPYPDGSFSLASYGYAREAYTQTVSKLFDRVAANEVASTNISQVTSAVTPAFAPDGRKVAFNFWAGPGAGGVTAGAGRSLAVFDFTCGAPAGSTKCAAGTTPVFSGLREIYRDNARWPGWPSFLPDSKAVIFHNTLNATDHGTGNDCRAAIVQPPPNINNCQLTTWKTSPNGTGATAEIWIAKDGTTPDAKRLDALNGISGGNVYLPKNASHPDDSKLNYIPTVNPVASGGYYWVVFTTRRMYGNLLTGDPYGNGTNNTKKLWVAAIDINNPNAAADPSHPAFYLPGQELNAGNTRGFWVVDPCKANGSTCETGDECCNGFCRKDPQSGGLVCIDKPPGGQCAQEFEKCTVDADCCDPSFQCIAGKCSRPNPVIK